MGNKEVAVLEAISKEIMINPSEGEVGCCIIINSSLPNQFVMY